MANTTLFVLFLVIFVPLAMVTTEARLLQGQSPAAPMQIKNIDSQRLLNELGFDHTKLEHYRKSAILVPDRRPPGGPDPQHH